MLHLRNINLYVETALAEWRTGRSLAPGAARQEGPLPTREPLQLAGTSSYGMSGVNAHALLEMPQATGLAEPATAAPALLRRERHWALAPALHLAARALPSPGSAACSFLTSLGHPDLAHLWDHKVRLVWPAVPQSGIGAERLPAGPRCHAACLGHTSPAQVAGRAILPGTAMLEACVAAASELLGAPSAASRALQDASIAAPLVLRMESPALLEAAVSLQHGGVQLRSIGAGGSTTHCNGCVRALASQPAVRSAVAQPGARHSSHAAVQRLASTAAAAAASAGQRAALASVWVPHAAQQGGYSLSPAQADAVLHLAGAFSSSAAPLRVPVGAGSLMIQSSRAGHSCWQHASAAPAASSSSSSSSGDSQPPALSFQLHGQHGSPVLQLANLLLKEAGGADASAAGSSPAAHQSGSPVARTLYCTEWQAVDQLAAGSSAPPQPHRPAWRAAGDGRTLAYQAAAARHSAAAVTTACTGLELLQSLVPGLPADGSLGLHVVSAPGVQPSCNGSGRLPFAAGAACSLAALTKVAGTELAASLHSSSLDAAVPAADVAASPCTDDAFGTAGSGGTVLQARLLRQPAAGAAELHDSHLMPMPRGSLANLRPVPHSQVAPGPGEVKVWVRAVGLNFRDVLNVLGMYPGDPGAPGGDCAGVIAAVGPGVQGLVPGE